jgi:hypothetical protein
MAMSRCVEDKSRDLKEDDDGMKKQMKNERCVGKGVGLDS